MARYLSPSQWLRGSSSFPNGYVGRRAFPIEAEIRPAAIPVGQNTHPQQAAFQLHILCWATSNSVSILWRSSYRIPGGGADPSTDRCRLRRYRSCSRPFLLDQVAHTVSDLVPTSYPMADRCSELTDSFGLGTQVAIFASDRMGAVRSTLFTWPVQGEHLTGRDLIPMEVRPSGQYWWPPFLPRQSWRTHSSSLLRISVGRAFDK